MKALPGNAMYFLKSTRLHRLMKHGMGSFLYRSGAFQTSVLAKNYLSSYYAGLRDREVFGSVESFCLFVGHNKSGTSMIGALLDAHPNATVADDVGALEYVSAGFSRDQVFHVLLRASRIEFLKGRVTARRLTPYSYLVPGQWQGRHDRLQVIGDGAAGSTTKRFAAEPRLLGRLTKVMGPVNVKFIQVIRNPYDPITVSMVRGKRTFENALEQYFANCETMVELRKGLSDTNLFAVRYEDFVCRPELQLAQLCRYLGIAPHDDYLRACASILHDTPHRNRQMVKWDPRWIQIVRDRLERYDFLRGYSFEQ